MLATVLDNLITRSAVAFSSAVTLTRLKHPATPQAAHSHTVAFISQDAEGYWLELKCLHHDCKGEIKKRLLPEQVEAWESED